MNIVQALLVLAVGLFACLQLYRVIPDRCELRITNEELADAHAECQVRDTAFRSYLARYSQRHYEAWRKTYREAESIRYIQRFRLMWDGEVSA